MPKTFPEQNLCSDKNPVAIAPGSDAGCASNIQVLRVACVFLLLFGFSVLAFPQSTDSNPSGPRGVIRLRVRVKTGESMRGLPRKRFFLIKGSLEQNKSVLDAIEGRSVITRDCFYRGAGASAQLINWLRQNDCESVYCREIEKTAVEGSAAVPEFVAAVAAGEKEFGSRETARKWLTVNLPERLRDGFYRQRQSFIETVIRQAESVSATKVQSVMTDRNGTAYFTDLEPGVYTLTNIVPVESDVSTSLWNCEMQVKPGDLATEKPYLISNRKEKNVKCVSVEKPLPTCDVQRRVVQ